MCLQDVDIRIQWRYYVGAKRRLFSFTETTREAITAAESIVLDETILSAAIFIEVLKCKRRLIWFLRSEMFCLC